MNSEFTSDFFDDASIAWRMNKVYQQKGIFRYICGVKKTDGTICRKPVKHRRRHPMYRTIRYW